MSKPFSILMDSRSHFEAGEPGGVWLSLPATAEQLHTALERVGIAADNPQDVVIGGFANTEEYPFDVPLSVIQGSTMNELNYLGALLEIQSADEREQFIMAMALGEYTGSVKDLINLTQNLDGYQIYPAIHSEADYGHYRIDQRKELELPEEARKYFQYEEYGRDAVQSEKGQFTEQGYVYHNGNPFSERYNGQETDIPEAYRIMHVPRLGPEKSEQEETPGQEAQTAAVPDLAAEPTVTIQWSESSQLREGETIPLSRANTLFKTLDEANLTSPGYDKTKFRIDYVRNGIPDYYEGRQDLGDGEGSLIAHMKQYHTYYAGNPGWDRFLLQREGREALEADKKQREMLLHEWIPYLELHCSLFELDRIAGEALQKGDALPPAETAYHTAMQAYVFECRKRVNQGESHLPPAPQLRDFDPELQAYKEHVKAELAQEAEAAGMTVEEYAANGYEPQTALGENPASEVQPAPEPDQDTPAAANLTELQQKAVAIAKGYEKLPMKDKIEVIAQAFGCTSGKIKTSPCTGKWRGTSDISITFDNGASLFIGNHRTPKAKTARVQNGCINSALVRYNPEIIRATKEAAIAALRKRETKDNELAVQKGLKPYTLLNVELNDRADEKSGGYMGWYYVTIAVDGNIHAHIETGLNYAILEGKVSKMPTREAYFTAGALKEPDVDYVFNNVGFSSTSTLYSLPIREEVRKRAEQTLAERRKARPAVHDVGHLDSKEVPEFLQGQKHPAPDTRMTGEKSGNRIGNPSAADELEAKARSGSQISLTEYAAALKAEKKAPVRAQPKENQQIRTKSQGLERS